MSENGVNRTNSVLKLVSQSIGIIAVVLLLIYFPVNTKIDAVNGKVDSIWAQHTKDCQSMINQTIELKKNVETKLEEKNLKLYLNPLVTAVNDMKVQLDGFRKEMIEILKESK